MIHIRPKSIPSGATGTAYAAAYSTVTNQVSSGISPAPTYDANGNQTTSTPATLTWNALNQPITVNSTTATYDALGRMVEKGLSGTYTQFVFRPSGTILAVYSSGLVKGTIPLPGGSTAIYNASGLNYIRHTDWLGSSRFATTWAHAVFSKEAYAPLGETYNEAGTPDRSFTGQDQDILTGAGGNGVYDFLFRKYDPSAGRWLSPDPAGWGVVDQTDPRSLDRYAYVENQPVNWVDPYGLSPPCGGFYQVSGEDDGPEVSPWLIVSFSNNAFGLGSDSYGPEFNCYGGGDGEGSGANGNTGNGAPNSGTSTCTVGDGRTTGVAPGQAPGPPGSVAIDPVALGLSFGTTFAENSPTVGLLKSYGSQITLSFSPAPNLPQGFPTTYTVLGAVGPAKARIGGANFNGLFDFDFFGLPSLAAANAATSNAGVPVAVTVTYPSSLPIFCSGQNIDSPISGPLPGSPGPVPAAVTSGGVKW